MATFIRRFKLRRDTAANWVANNPILQDGEPGRETDTRKEKRGDGVTAWNSLPYFAGGALAGLDTVTNSVITDATIQTTKLATTRAVVASDGSTSGTLTIPAVTGTIVNQGQMMYNSSGLAQVYALSAWKSATGLDAQGLIDSISTLLGTAWQGGGSANTVPATMGTGDWSISDPATDNDLTINYITLPANGGSAITALQYELDGSGTWTSVAGTGTGTRNIAGLNNNQSYSVKVRAVNAVGNATASAAKTATPTSASGSYTPVFVSTNSGVSTFSVPLNFTTDNNKFTFALNANRSDSTGTKYIWAFPGRGSLQVQGGTMYIYLVSDTNSGLYEATFNVGTGAHAFAISADLSVPSVEIRRDGTLLTVTGDAATGINQTLAPIAGNIDWTQGAGTFSFFNAGPNVFVGTVADMYLEVGAARATSLFFSGTNPTAWNAIGSPQIAPGHGRSAANWNSGLHDGSATVTATGWV